MSRLRLLALGAFACACAPACAPSKGSSGSHGVGHRLMEGGGQALQVAPRSGAVTYLHEPAHPKGKLMPPDAYIGELTLVSPDGSVHPLGPEATNLIGNVAFSADGQRVAFLEHFDFQTQRGDLAVADTLAGHVDQVSSDVSYFGFGGVPEALGYIRGSGGELHVGSALVDRDVATFEFSHGAFLYRLRSAAGGALKTYRPGGSATVIAEKVGDYRVSPDGKSLAYTQRNADGTADLHLNQWGANDRKVGSTVWNFEFSPSGSHVAFVAGADQRKLELWVGDARQPLPAKQIGKFAGTYRFSADGRLGFLHDYYDPTRSGKFSLWDPQHGTTLVADSARVFGFSPSGKYLAYLKRITKPLYTEQLMLLPLGPVGSPLPPERLEGEAIYAFDFTPDEKGLLYKTDCTREGEACELMSVPTDAPAAPATDGGPPKNPLAKKLVSGVDDYDFSPDRKWLWVTFKAAIGNVVDLAVLPAEGEPGLPRYIDFKVEPGPRWTQTGKIAYLVNNPKRAGVYLGDPAEAQPLKTH